MKTVYNPDIIQEFADRLYAKANSVTRSYTALGVILLGFAGLATGRLVFAAVGGLIGGAVGYAYGKEKAFAHKLQAQTALCQVQIEKNLRK